MKPFYENIQGASNHRTLKEVERNPKTSMQELVLSVGLLVLGRQFQLD